MLAWRQAQEGSQAVIDPVMAHSLHWFEAALFAPAFAILLVAVVRDRRWRRSRQKSGGRLQTTTKD